MDAVLLRSIDDSEIERFTGTVRHYTRFDYRVGQLGPFSLRLYHDEHPEASARVDAAAQLMRTHARALSPLFG